MEGISETIKPILDKVIDFFHIFDLSYIISGFATSTSIFLWLHSHDEIPDINLSSKQLIVVGIMSCYILGLLSFGVGRFFRRYIYNPFVRTKFVKFIFRSMNTDEDFEQINQMMNTTYSSSEFEKVQKEKWAILRADDSKKESLKHLNRYWVMTATTDGLTFASYITIILTLCSCSNFDNCLSFVLLLVFSVIAMISFTRQANKSQLNQIKELFVTIP